MSDPTAFDFEYAPARLRYGPNCVAGLEAAVAKAGADRALVVCGRTVGSTETVVGPVRDGLDERLSSVFAETTPQKRLETAVAGAERVAETDADALVALGGGSSLDVAKAVATVAGRGLDREAAVEEFVRTNTLAVEDPLPVLAVPTTLAGADLSQGSGLSAAKESVEAVCDVEEPEEVGGGLSDPALMPAACLYDPELFRTTPGEVLAASAMNGFDKAIEVPYARNATPVTDATAVRALELLRVGLPKLGRGDRDDRTMRQAVVGTVLAQYGVSRPGAGSLSVVHAFGHGLRDAGLQQGVGHAVVAPHAISSLFDRVDGRRHLLAEGLGVDATDRTDAEVANAIVGAVATVRDGLGLPARLRDVDGPDREDLDDVARAVAADSFLDNGPDGFDPDVEVLRGVLEAAW